jgi:Serine/Threonine/Tyrosine Kinase found in polyvalent proteins
VKDFKSFKDELQNIIAGKSSQSESHSIQAAKAYLRADTKASGEGKNEKPGRSEEERALKEYTSLHNLFIAKNYIGNYITSGAEQKVYYKDGETVLKLADAIFYVNWTDYFDNFLLHNYFFPDTAYTLVGFLEEEGSLFAAVKQSFVLQTQDTNLENVKEYLLSNGFVHKKNNDFYHPYLGIILEDLHDENVLTNEGTLFFVDTVFYLTEDFYK